VRSLRLQLTIFALVAGAIRNAAFEIGPVRRADGVLTERLHVEWGSVPYRVGNLFLTLFDPALYALLLVAVVGAALVRGRRLQAALAAGVMLGATLTTEILKVVLAEHRPGYVWLPPTSWPSGHTTAAAALALALVLVTPRGHRAPVAVVGAVLTVLAGIALVALGRHYPSDVLGGLCVAGAWGAMAFAAERRLSRRPARSARPTPARDG
jgi:membrane-associated phospholipid phosphatase